MPRKKYRTTAIDEELEQKLFAIGEEALAKPLGIVPSIPAVIRYLVKHYEQTTKKGKR